MHDRIALLRGVRMVGALSPNGGWYCGASAPPEELQGFCTAVRACASLFHILSLHRVPSERFRWVFRRGIIHCLWQNGVGAIAVLTDHRPAEVDLAGLERALQQARAGLPTANFDLAAVPSPALVS